MLEHFGKPCLDAYIVCSPRRFVSSLLHSWSSHSQLASLASGDQQSIQQQSSRYSGCLASDSQIFSSCSDWEEPHVWSIMKSSLNWFYWTKQHETTWNKTSKNIKSTMQNDALRCSLSHFRYSEAMFIKKSSWSTWLGILSAKPGSAAVRHRHRRDDVTLDAIFVWFGLVRYGFTETLNLISFEFFWYFLAGSMESIPLLTIAWKCAIQIPSWRTGMGWQCGNVAT